MNNHSNDLEEIVAQALEGRTKDSEDKFDLSKVNLAELERRTGISRAKLRRIKRNGFRVLPNGNKGKKHEVTVLTGFTGLIDLYLQYLLTSTTFTIRMAAKWYQRVVSRKNKTVSYQSNISPSFIKPGIFICFTPFLFWIRSFLVSRYFGYPSLILSKGRYSLFSVSMLFIIVIATWIYA